MWVLIGFAIIFFAVFGGFVMSGGHLAALFQPFELLMIAGGGAGAFVIGNGIEVTKRTMGELKKLFKPSKVNRTFQLHVLAMLYDLMVKARREGLLALEKEVERPDQSAIMRKYPDVLEHHEVMAFITDYFLLMVSGNMDTAELEPLMDQEIEVHHQEGEVPAMAVTKIGDAMPGFGIVAAVMGVVHTMESVGLPPEQLGMLIARALVGTFLGILLAYGFIGPLAQLMEMRVAETTRLLQAVKNSMLAFVVGYTPMTAVEFGRKALFTADRPSLSELEARLKGGGGAAESMAA
jgi:chemotaxis protein MotA